MRKALLVILVSTMLVTLFAGCAQEAPKPAAPKTETKPAAPPAPAKPIKIGVSMPLTGPVALNGEMITKSVKLAVKQINAKGGIKGRPIELKIADDRSDPKEGANIANMFVQDPDIVCVICNANSSVYLAAAPIYNKGKLPSISPDCSSPLLTNNGPYINRITLSDALQGAKEAEFIWQDGHRKIAIFFENTDFGRGVYAACDNRFKALGGEILAVEAAVLGESKDFSPIITKFRRSGAQAVAIGANYTESALLVKQMRASNLNIPVYGTQGLFTPAFLQIGGKGVEGVFTHGGVTLEEPTPELLQFQKDYEAEYNIKGEIGKYTTEGYDVANMFIECMLNGGAEREKIKEYLAGMKQFKGAQTTYTFIGGGDVDFVLKRFVVKDGQFKLFKPK
jgi:branched-chain amino acid transport system substrate-binding protein